MMIDLFLKGLIMGLLIAAPVGPIAILCMKRTLQDGFRMGFATGMGAASADLFYGAVAAFGVAAVGDFLNHYSREFSIGGGIVLLILGWRILAGRGHPEQAPVNDHPRSYFKAWMSAMILTATNPITFLAFAAMLTMLGVAVNITEFQSASLLLAGIFTGSTLWWGGLALGMKSVKHLVSEKMLFYVNTCAGIGLLLFGAYALMIGSGFV